MIYTTKPSYTIYPLAIFFYIGCWELMMDCCWDNIIIYGFIIMIISLILYYWNKDFAINYKPFYGVIIVLIINKIINYKGIMVHDEAIKKNGYIFLKTYFFIPWNQEGKFSFLLNKVNNEYIITNIKSLVMEPKNLKFFYWIKKIFPTHYSFFYNLITGDKIDFDGYKFFNYLGLHYITFAGFHTNIILHLLIKMFSFFFNTIISHWMGYLSMTIILIFIVYHNPKLSIFLLIIRFLLKFFFKVTGIHYHKWFWWFFLFLLIHSYNPLILYHPGFIMSFFLSLFFFFNKEFFIIFCYYRLSFFKYIINNLLILTFSIHFFNFFSTFYFFYNIIFKDYFSIMIIVVFLTLLLPFFGRYLDNFFGLSMPFFKILMKYNYLIGTFHNCCFNKIILFLFLFYSLFCLKFIRIWEITFYLILLVIIYFIIFVGSIYLLQ